MEAVSMRAKITAAGLSPEQRRVLCLTRRQPDLFDEEAAILVEPHDRINSSTFKALHSRGLTSRFEQGILRLTALGSEVVKAVIGG